MLIPTITAVTNQTVMDKKSVKYVSNNASSTYSEGLAGDERMNVPMLSISNLGELYDATGLNPGFMRQIFAGQHTSEKTICKIADFLKVPPWEAYRQILLIRSEIQKE